MTLDSQNEDFGHQVARLQSRYEARGRTIERLCEREMKWREWAGELTSHDSFTDDELREDIKVRLRSAETYPLEMPAYLVRISELEDQVDTLRAENRCLEEHADNAESDSMSSCTRAACLQKELDAAKSNFASAESRLIRVQNANIDLETEKKNLESQVAQLQQQVETQSKNIEYYYEENRRLEGKLSEVHGALEKTQASALRHARERDSFEHHSIEMEEKLAATKSALGVSRAANMVLQAKLDNIRGLLGVES